VPMARYFFHIRNGSDVISDDKGIELPNLAAAKIKAQRTAGYLVKSAQPHACPDAWVIQISDQHGNVWGQVAIASLKWNSDHEENNGLLEPKLENLVYAKNKPIGPSRENKAAWEKISRSAKREN
jgi:hypothetical protein